jgi:hypothetical protein
MRKSERNRAVCAWVIIHYTQAGTYSSSEHVTSLRCPTRHARLRDVPDGYHKIYEITSPEVKREVDCLINQLNYLVRVKELAEELVCCCFRQHTIPLSDATPVDNNGVEGTQRYACHECMREDTKEEK